MRLENGHRENSTMSETKTKYRPRMSQAGLAPTHDVIAVDEYGNTRDMQIAGEFPLTIKVDDREIVTLMTLGTYPEALTLGYLRNQRLIEDLQEIASVEVDWDREQVAVTTPHGKGIVDQEEKLSKRTVTTGCAQGTVFSCTLDKLYDVRLPEVTLKQSTIYALLRNLAAYNEIYKRAGAVHGCALCADAEILTFVEDVGRHNAADAISGMMWLDGVSGADKLFYTTGRLTSEIVMKVALMGIPTILSRSGITHMGLEIAQDLGVIMLARAKGQHFLVYNCVEQIDFDAKPRARPGAGASAKPVRVA
jgi:FdhD protein